METRPCPYPSGRKVSGPPSPTKRREAAVKRLQGLKKAGKVRLSTRVGLWVPSLGCPTDQRTPGLPRGPVMHSDRSLGFP